MVSWREAPSLTLLGGAVGEGVRLSVQFLGWHQALVERVSTACASIIEKFLIGAFIVVIRLRSALGGSEVPLFQMPHSDRHQKEQKRSNLRCAIVSSASSTANSRRVATRYDKLSESFAAFVLLACIRIWIKFAHTA
jgi:hypothetical protein